MTQSAFTEICKQMIDSSPGSYKDQVVAGVAKNAHDVQRVEGKVTETKVSEWKEMPKFGVQNEDVTRPFSNALVDEIADLLKDGQTGQKSPLRDIPDITLPMSAVKGGKADVYMASPNSSLPGHSDTIRKSLPWSNSHSADESRVCLNFLKEAPINRQQIKYSSFSY